MKSDKANRLSGRRLALVGLLVVGLPFFAGCDLFESPTEPEDSRSDPVANEGVADDLSTCFVRTDGTGPGFETGTCTPGEACWVLMEFESSCRNRYSVSVRWTSYGAAGNLVGVGSECSFLGQSRRFHERAVHPLAGQSTRIYTCFYLPREARRVAARVGVCRYEALRTNSFGDPTCFEDDAPPSTGDAGGAVEPEWRPL